MVDASRFADNTNVANMKVVLTAFVHDPSERFADVAALVKALVVDGVSAQFVRPVKRFAADIEGDIEDPRDWLDRRFFCLNWRVSFCRIHLASFDCIIEPQVSTSAVTIKK